MFRKKPAYSHTGQMRGARGLVRLQELYRSRMDCGRHLMMFMIGFGLIDDRQLERELPLLTPIDWTARATYSLDGVVSCLVSCLRTRLERSCVQSSAGFSEAIRKRCQGQL